MISVDSKKQELIGDYKNAGHEWRPAAQLVKVKTHDFPGQAEKAIPYEIYDMAANTGWVSIGNEHDTAAFAVASIRNWWQARGRHDYPRARRLLITADGGVPMAIAPAAGRPSSPTSLPRTALRPRCPTYRQAPPSGTRSNTGCYPTSP